MTTLRHYDAGADRQHWLQFSVLRIFIKTNTFLIAPLTSEVPVYEVCRSGSTATFVTVLTDYFY
jgi:hypothetical protein